MMNVETIKFIAMHDDTQYPDPSERLLYACFDRDYLIIPSGEYVYVGLGIRAKFPSSIRIRLHTTSSLAALGVQATTEYVYFEDAGEWVVRLHNFGANDVMISKLTFDELKAKYANYYKNSLKMDRYYIPLDCEELFSTDNVYRFYIEDEYFGTEIISYDDPIIKFEVEYVPPYVLA